MKISFSSKRSGRRAYALALVVVFIAIGLTVLAATLLRTATTSGLNERNNQYMVNLFAAEAATEKILARMQTDYRNGNQALVINNLSSYASDVPSTNENSYWNDFQFMNASMQVGKTYIYNTSSSNAVIDLPNPYAGLLGIGQIYRIISTVVNKTGRYTITTAVQQDVGMVEIPAFQFAIFYNGLLEFTWAAPMTIRGRVHANGDLYTGSSSSSYLTFMDAVTVSGDIYDAKSWAGYSSSDMTGPVTYPGGSETSAKTLNLPIGTTNTAANVREIINLPKASEDLTNGLGSLRFYNQAQMTIVVSNNSVKAWARDTSGTSYTKSNTLTWNSITNFVSTNNYMYDAREGKIVRFTQIDISKMNTWANTSTNMTNVFGKGLVPKIIYIADMRTSNSTTMPAVRLINGSTLATNNSGLTLATINPLYVKGNYNVPNTADLNTTNTANSQPASLISDALTVLSSSWTDSSSSNSFSSKGGSRVATNTTINAAIITGMVNSAGTDGDDPFSGGAMNVTRLLEDWSSKSQKLTLNTSIINLFESARARGEWQKPGGYYLAPTRDFNFDQNFRSLSKLPPGTPTFRVPIVVSWYNPPPGVTNYTGP